MVLRPRPEQLSRPKRVYRGTQNNIHPTRWTRWTMCNQLVQLVHGGRGGQRVTSLSSLSTQKADTPREDPPPSGSCI